MIKIKTIFKKVCFDLLTTGTKTKIDPFLRPGGEGLGLARIDILLPVPG